MKINRLVALLAGLTLSMTAAAQTTTQKYFGYFAGDTVNTLTSPPSDIGFNEMKDHSNLYAIMAWPGDTSPSGKAVTQSQVLEKLAAAKAAHVHAIVPAYPFVFQATRASNGEITCWNNDPSAAASWASLSQAMVDQGYLIPGDPVHSTVVAVYIVDEPNGPTCLNDVNGQANPAFVNGMNAVRQDPRTSALPIASILSGKGFDKFFAGMKMLDWVGFDEYGDDDGKWSRTFAALKQYAPGKKYIVVPGATQGCDQVDLDPTARFFNAIENDPDVTWLAPFVWFSGLDGTTSCKGVRDLPATRAAYTAEGLKIRALQCNSSPGDAAFCRGSAGVTAAINLLLQ
ncbi:hypothetical protein [Luteibacter aegosomatissinici]|uniref:hypothetical protein n=1 Tax=Luteibacter aegosomatissinici TaxID=2911539 RepID=UPI001FFB3A88|nr:hypothetical protein [Luteibacter aegosomatissinici]UPG95877.1 hypothetical protein L2Y97_07160 [Luteibacter aegosomatissinici]